MTTIVAVRARAFSGHPVESITAMVEDDGSVLVWDSVAGHYTRCHSLSRHAENRIRERARAQASWNETKREFARAQRIQA